MTSTVSEYYNTIRDYAATKSAESWAYVEKQFDSRVKQPLTDRREEMQTRATEWAGVAEDKLTTLAAAGLVKLEEGKLLWNEKVPENVRTQITDLYTLGFSRACDATEYVMKLPVTERVLENERVATALQWMKTYATKLTEEVKGKLPHEEEEEAEDVVVTTSTEETETPTLTEEVEDTGVEEE